MNVNPYHIAYVIAREMNFAPFDETKFEYWEIDETDKVFMLANTDAPTRMHYLIDETEFQ